MQSTTRKVNLKGRSLLTLADYTPDEVRYLLDYAAELKALKNDGRPHRWFEGKNVALLFEKGSTRTRAAFAVACSDLGIHTEFLGKSDLHLGKKESIEDTAKVLGRMFDGIEFRGYEQGSAEALAKYSGVPVWNGLTDEYHPTQVLADFLTIKESTGTLKGKKLVYAGDGRNNVANSLMIGAAKTGMDLCICAPKELFPEQDKLEKAQEMAQHTEGSITVAEHFEEVLEGASAVYTDVWVSMGEEDQFEKRINLLKPYQITMDVMRKTGNEDVLFMHCLPAFHNLETETAKEVHDKFGLEEMEVTDEVFRSKHSCVFDQAENRLHTIKALIAATLEK